MKTDAAFLASLANSESAVLSMGKWLRGLGADVLMRPTVARPEYKSRMAYVDAGDLEIRLRVEVKHRDIEFTSAADYPYPTVLVDEARKAEQHSTLTLWGYLIVSRSRTHFCFISATTKKHWTVVKLYDRFDGAVVEFMEVDPALCAWGRIG